MREKLSKAGLMYKPFERHQTHLSNGLRPHVPRRLPSVSHPLELDRMLHISTFRFASPLFLFSLMQVCRVCHYVQSECNGFAKQVEHVHCTKSERTVSGLRTFSCSIRLLSSETLVCIVCRNRLAALTLAVTYKRFLRQITVSL